VIKPASRTTALVSWVDLLPTLLSAAGGKPSDDIDGRSFLPVLRGTSDSHRDAIYTTHSGDGNWNVYPQRAVRVGKWKYIRNLHPEFAFTSHVDLADPVGKQSYFDSWRDAAKNDPKAAEVIRHYNQRSAEELFDLEADPFEQHNLAGDPNASAELSRLRKQLDDWMGAQGDKQTVFGKPRLLSDPASYGPDAPGGDGKARKRPNRK
jgi:uncharacterized sulfatase